MTAAYVIGNGPNLPWHISEELKFFKETTLNKTLIMGSTTLESIGKVLPNRNHVIVSSKPPEHFSRFPNVVVAKDIETAIIEAKKFNTEVFVSGGKTIYQQFLDLGVCDRLIISWIKKEYVGDVFFPDLSNYPYKFNSVLKENDEFITMDYVK